MWCRFHRATLLLCGLGCALTAPALLPAFQTPDPAVSPLQPLQAELSEALDISHLTAGAVVTARVTENWKRADCPLKSGSVIQGHVTELTRRSKTEKTSSFKLLFDHAPCKGSESMLYSFTLIAVVGPPPEAFGANDGSLESSPLAASITTGGHSSLSGGAGSTRGLMTVGIFDSNTRSSAQASQLPARVLPGQVVGLPKIELQVGVGAGDASTISMTKGNVRLGPKTTLVLVPAVIAAPAHSTGLTTETAAAKGSTKENGVSPGINDPAATTVASEPPDETEICRENCNVLGSTMLHSARVSDPISMLGISALGYAPHDKKRVSSFDSETTLTYLDEHHLLCTFDPHALRSRSTDGADTIRQVRAVMIDPTVPKVLGVMEWRVRGNDAYLWHYGQNQVLVHMEHELRLLDAQLETVRSIPLEGTVAWVAASPANDHLAVGIVRQREGANQFLDVQGAGQLSQEDLEVQVYDRDWNVVSTSLRPRNSAEPALSGDGELRVTHVSRGRWKISEYGWNRTEHVLATVRSACRPQVSAPVAELTFVTGCMATSGNPWYRMLGADGHTLLKAEAGSDEIVQSSKGGSAGLFAVRVFKAANPMSFDKPFERSDLVKEEIGVYRSANGSRLASVVTDDFILSLNAYALSPTAQQMAVVGKDSIHFYRLDPH